MTLSVMSLTQLDALDRSNFLIFNFSIVALRTFPSVSSTLGSVVAVVFVALFFLRSELRAWFCYGFFL